MSSWLKTSSLLLVFFAGLALGSSGLFPTAHAIAGGDLAGGDESALYWKETDEVIEFFNLAADERYLLVAEMADEPSADALGEDRIVYLDGNVSLSKDGTLDVTAYRLEGIARWTSTSPELIRPCINPPVDCPTPGWPPIPDEERYVVLSSETVPQNFNF